MKKKDKIEEDKTEDEIQENNDPIILTKKDHDELLQQAAESNKNKDLYLRAQAEFDNFRKRTIKERQDLIKYAEETIISDLLVVVDDFNRGLLAAEQSNDFDMLLQGVQMVQKHLMSVLQQRGLVKIDCIGKPFDPNTQEPIQEQETDEFEEGTVTKEMQTGYMLNGKVVRTAKVMVAKPIIAEIEKE